MKIVLRYFLKQLNGENSNDEFESLIVDSSTSTFGHEQLLEKYILTDNRINSILNS